MAHADVPKGGKRPVPGGGGYLAWTAQGLEVRQAHGIIAELATPADEFRSGRAITNDAASMARRGSQLDQLSVASVRRI